MQVSQPGMQREPSTVHSPVSKSQTSVQGLPSVSGQVRKVVRHATATPPNTWQVPSKQGPSSPVGVQSWPAMSGFGEQVNGTPGAGKICPQMPQPPAHSVSSGGASPMQPSGVQRSLTVQSLASSQLALPLGVPTHSSSTHMSLVVQGSKSLHVCAATGAATASSKSNTIIVIERIDRAPPLARDRCRHTPYIPAVNAGRMAAAI